MNLSNHYLPIRAVCGRTAAVVRAATFALLLGAALPLAAQTAGSSKFIQTFLVYYGGGPRLVAGDAQKMAKFDLIDTNKHRYDEIAPTPGRPSKPSIPISESISTKMARKRPTLWIRGHP